MHEDSLTYLCLCLLLLDQKEFAQKDLFLSQSRLQEAAMHIVVFHVFYIFDCVNIYFSTQFLHFYFNVLLWKPYEGVVKLPFFEMILVYLQVDDNAMMWT